jgi:lipopolysaccharide biosynthesis glycosyltransferase
MADCCIVYISDANYLFPTLVSAITARRNTAETLADVRIVAAGLTDPQREAFAPACENENIDLRPMPAAATGTLARLLAGRAQDFSGRISVTAFGRLFIEDILPERYSDFLYIDGDTQVTGSLDPLIRTAPPEGKFLAARDYTSLMLRSQKPWVKSVERNFDRLGMAPERRQNYFNSGVIRGRRAGWREAGAQALRYYLDRPGLAFHDQDALNGALADRHELMSNRWNFPRHLLGSWAFRELQPAIIHYMSQPKPWHGVYAPWSDAEFRPYVEVARRYPRLAAHLPRLSLARRLAYKAKALHDYLVDRPVPSDAPRLRPLLFDRRFVV